MLQSISTMNRSPSSTYEPLLTSDHGDVEKHALEHHRPARRCTSPWLILVLVLSLVVNGWQLWISRSMSIWRGDKQLYSPVLKTLTHTNHVFPALLDISKWHGPPTDEVDDAWNDLYKYGLSAIHRDQMLQMANRSDPIHGKKDQYLVSLDVFHQLHCLNTIRKSLWPEHYPEIAKQRYTTIPGNPPWQFDHLDHCINSVRESLMCNADITPTVWVTGPDHKSKTRFDVLHTCRDWESVTSWAKKNELKTYIFTDSKNTNGEVLPAPTLGHEHSLP